MTEILYNIVFRTVDIALYFVKFVVGISDKDYIVYGL